MSLSSGRTSRQIVPHALVDNGQRWHVRAYDRANARFSDFVITRISKAMVLDGDETSDDERAVADEQWNRMVELTLVPHPQLTHKGPVEADYDMRNGTLSVTCRAAVADYALRRWGVDCSEGYYLDPAEYQLALGNRGALAQTDSAAIAPGYVAGDRSS